MEVFLPIAQVFINPIEILLLSAIVGVLSGLFGVGGGFLMTPFLIFMGLSLLWSKAENGSSSYLVLLLVVAFTECLRIAYESLPFDRQDKFKHLLNISLIVGIVFSISVGSYPHIWPEFSDQVNEIIKNKFASTDTNNISSTGF